MAQPLGALASTAPHGFKHRRRRQGHASTVQLLDQDAGKLAGPDDGLGRRGQERDGGGRGRAVERGVAARPHGLGEVRAPRGVPPGVVVVGRGRDRERAGDVGEHSLGRRLAGFERPPGMAQVQEHERVAEAVGVPRLAASWAISSGPRV
jgi:hypothetical protein